MKSRNPAIGMVLEGYYPPDIRVTKEMRALRQAEIDVHLLCYAQETHPANEHNDLLSVHRWVSFATHCHKKLGRLIFFDRLIFYLRFISPTWRKAMVEFVNEYDIKIIHIHDLPLVKTALSLKKEFPHLKIVADLHENMPAAYRAYRSGMPLGQKILSLIVRNYTIWRWYECSVLNNCDRIIVVVPEAAERLLSAGIAQERIYVVSNTEDETTFNAKREDCVPEILEKYKSMWVASYIGGIGPHRGLDTVLNSLSYIRKSIPDFKLVIVGAKLEQQNMILKQARTLKVQDLVEIIGWQPFEKVNSYVFASQVCLVPHNNFEHTQTTIPHKLFQYMLCGKLVLVSNCRPLARVVTESDSGYVFEANNSKDLADKLLLIYSHPDKAQEKALNGKRAALDLYAWQHDARRLRAMYTQLIDELPT